MKYISYLFQDALNPVGEGLKYIVHCCNDAGLWGSGFVVAISKKWTDPELQYRRWKDRGSYTNVHDNNSQVPFELGEIQPVLVDFDTYVVNLIGQHNVGRDEYGNPPIRYDAFERGLDSVFEMAKSRNGSLHMPYKIASDRAGGDWDTILKMISDRAEKHQVMVYIYDPFHQMQANA